MLRAWNIRADASLYSEPIAIDAFLDDWQDPDFKSGKYAFAHGLMQLSVQQDQWNLGWLWRYDYILKFSPDMAKLYYQIENDLPLDAESMYELTLHAQHLERIGARIAYDWVPQIKLDTYSRCKCIIWSTFCRRSI